MKRIVTGLMAHVDAGKTTLSEAMLYRCGVIRRLGRVDKKDAYLDNYSLERERGITIFSKQAVFKYGEAEFTLIDTPGHVDFSTEMERALSVLDTAVLIISAPDKVQAHTRTLWRLLKLYDIPTYIFVNKMDRVEETEEEILEHIQKAFGSECISFKTKSEEFYEKAASHDESAIEEFFDKSVLSNETVSRLIYERKIFPVYFGSALKCEGVDELIEGLAEYAPDIYEEQTFSGRVYKILHDSEGNRLSFIKITGGQIKTKEVLNYVSNRREEAAGSDEGIEFREFESISEKINQIRIYSGDRYTVTDTAGIGMLVAIPGLTGTYPGMGLGDEDNLLNWELTPVMTYKVITRDRSHMLELYRKLKELEEEDPTLNVMWNSDVKELQISVMGDIRLEILKSEILTRFGEEVSFGKGSVLYKETVTAPVLGVGHFEPLRHYAEVQLLIEPAPRGSEISAESCVSVNDLELNWQRLIITHIFEKEHRGVLTGAALTDVNIKLVAGRSHIKHTEGGDFRQATYRAVRQGLMRAREQGLMQLLEPMYRMRIELPREYIGRAMTDIEKRFGRIFTQEELDESGMVALEAVAPVASMQGYKQELIAYSKGLGSITLSYGGYMPCHNQEEIIAASGYIPENDLRNPASSVFCAHGAGFVVEWQDVDSYKHLFWDMTLKKLVDDEADIQSRGFVAHVKEEAWVSVSEVDAIIDSAGSANRREHKYKNPYRKHRTEQRRNAANEIGSGSAGRTRTVSSQANKEKYMLVDGYNIIFAWPELKTLAAENIDGARERLNDIMCNYQAVNKSNIIVVYDAYRVAGHITECYAYHNIKVIYTREAETADRFIERFAHENAKQYDVTVATSDGLEQIIIRGAGCRLLTAFDLLEEIKLTSEQISNSIKTVTSGNVGTVIGDKLKEIHSSKLPDSMP